MIYYILIGGGLAACAIGLLLGPSGFALNILGGLLIGHGIAAKYLKLYG